MSQCLLRLVYHGLMFSFHSFLLTWGTVMAPGKGLHRRARVTLTTCLLLVVLLLLFLTVCMFLCVGCVHMNAGTFEGHVLLLPPGIGVRDVCKLFSVGARYRMSPLQEQNVLDHSHRWSPTFIYLSILILFFLVCLCEGVGFWSYRQFLAAIWLPRIEPGSSEQSVLLTTKLSLQPLLVCLRQDFSV